MRGLTRSARPNVAAFALLAFCTLSGPLASTAHAQTGEADAERLFREGQKLMEERKFGEACPKFEGAYKKDKALGTLINLAFCHKEQGSTWYAWLEFREAEVKAIELNRPDRRDFARARLTELEKTLHKVIVDNPKKLPLTEVLVEDRKVWEAERGAVFATEGGSRKFVFRAKGKRQVSTLVVIANSTRPQHVPVPDMQDLTADDLPPPPAPVPVADTTKPDPGAAVVGPPPPRPETSNPQRTLGWVGIGVGSGAAVVGLATGAITFFGPCARNDCTRGQRSFASTSGAVSDVSFIAAGVLVAAGIILVVTAPSASTISASSALSRARVSGTGLDLVF